MSVNTDTSTLSNNNDYYDSLDLKFAEIAVAMQDIDRTNPGRVKFTIPVMTPTMNNSSTSDSTVHQTATNIQNGDTKPEVDNINVSNYMEIEVPKELCAFVGGEFEVLDGSWLKITGTQAGSGSVVEGGSFSVTGIVNGSVIGLLNLMPVDRYIPKGSKWAVMFIGGDITKPKIIARLPDD